MITPRFLNPNSKIRIVSPAGKVDEAKIMPAIEWLRHEGFYVEVGEHVFARHHQFAGTDEQRLSDLQTALNDPETDAIICARGGYGTIRIVDQLDFTKLPGNPKWLVGFSDITVLHACLHRLNVATVHGSMLMHLLDKDSQPAESATSLLQMLRGQEVAYTFASEKENRTGKASAEMVGGNLSVLASLQGTPYELETEGKILFIEEVDEYLYHTDRMMQQLKLAGKLGQLKGLVVGSFTNMKDNDLPFGQSVHEIIGEAVQEYNFPVCYGLPAGHGQVNKALVFGKVWQLEVNEKETALNLL